ncbi:MAG: hypothetical protein LBT10_08545 [Methanobrevibacter sp.]|jgi:hypothetical protein|nr:hypothetical protein [Methanobrevibacter sp.]
MKQPYSFSWLFNLEEKIFENDEFYYSLRVPNFEVEQDYKDNLTNILQIRKN